MCAHVKATRLLLLAGLVVAAALPPDAASAFVDKSNAFPAVEASQPLVLDGTVSNPQWLTGVTAKDFYDYTTRQPASPELATTAYILYDAKNLYVGFICVQSSLPIVAAQTTNGVGEELDDQVEIDIDPSGNGSRVYTFKTTPRGVRYQASSESDRYNPPWQAAASIRQAGWSAEMAVPLKDLRASGGSVQTWRINLQRHLAAKDEYFTWAYNPKMGGPDDSAYWPSVTDLRVGGSSTRPRPHADVFALSSIGSDRNQFQQTNGLFSYEPVRNFGADGTYPFTNTLAFVGTVNPDFSNVEVDQQTIAPQQFQRSLFEYRPFFAQGEQYLTPALNIAIESGAPDRVFYSPSIGTFNWGTKIEGTIKSDAIGLLAIGGPGFDDQAFGFDHLTPDQDFRYFIDGVSAHHTQDGSSVTPCPGTLLTCRDDTLQVGARKTDRASGWESSFQYGSESGDYVSDPGLAHDFVFDITRNMPFSGFDAGFRNIGPMYGPVDGYTQISDIRGPYADFGGGGVGAPGTALKSYGGFIAAERYVDRSGEVHYTEVTTDLTFGFKNRLTLDMGPSISELRTSSGYPFYLDSQTLPYDTTHVTLGYAEATASPVTMSYSWGPFASFCSVPPSQISPNPLFCGSFTNLYANFYLQQFDGSIARQLTSRFTISFQLAGSDERPFIGPSDGQWLRRISLGENLGSNANLSLDLRSINGTGGFSYPGVNLAASFHDHFGNGNELYVDFGSPASTATLDRLIVKYVLHIGQGGAGT